MEVGLSPNDFVLDGDPVPSPKRGRSPPVQFSAHVYCGQTAGCISMPLGTEVGLGPDDIVLDGDPLSLLPKWGRSPLPNFRPMSIVAKRLDGPRRHLEQKWALIQATYCAKWGPSSPPPKGSRGHLMFGSFLIIVAKRLDASRCHLVWR